MSNKALILAAIAREAQETRAALTAALAKHGISDADTAEILRELDAITETAPPAAGTFNVRLSKSSSGGTEAGMDIVLDNKGVSDARREELVDAAEHIFAAAQAAPADGEALASTLLLEVNSEVTSVALVSKAQANAADAAILAAFGALLASKGIVVPE